MLTVGQDGMLRHLAEKALQGSPPGLDEVNVEALHHALHDKLLWQRLRTKQEVTEVRSSQCWHAEPVHLKSCDLNLERVHVKHELSHHWT